VSSPSRAENRHPTRGAAERLEAAAWRHVWCGARPSARAGTLAGAVAEPDSVLDSFADLPTLLGVI
jgi:hypothetical protein